MPSQLPSLLSWKTIPLRFRKRALILPVEIWEEIAMYLDDDDIKGLVTLNSIFLELVLRSRYHTVTLFPFYKNECYAPWLLCRYRDRLAHLQELHISQRVRSLKVKPYGVYKYCGRPNEEPAFVRKIRTSIQAFRFQRSGLDLTEMTHNLVFNLPNVTALAIIAPYNPTDHYLQLVLFVWQYFMRRAEPDKMILRNLCLNLYSGKGAWIFDVPRREDELLQYRAALMKLEKFELTLNELSYAEQFSATHLETFSGLLKLLSVRSINAASNQSSFDPYLASNLTSLYVATFCDNSRMSTILNSIFEPLCAAPIPQDQSFIVPFPNMTHFSLNIDSLSTYDSVIRFLLLQRLTITHLRISPHLFVPSPSELAPGSLATDWAVAPAMTGLTYLEIASPGSFREPIGQKGVDTLRSLVVQSCPSSRSGLEPTTIRTIVVDPGLPVAYEDLVYLCQGTRAPHYDLGTPSPSATSLLIFQEASNHIHHLSMAFYTLTRSHLTYILSHFRNLQSLHLTILAKGNEAPFRGFIQPGREWRYRSVPRGVEIPVDPQTRFPLYATFLAELDQHRRTKLLQREAVVTWSKLEELRVRFDDVGDETIEVASEGLKGAFPEVKRIVMGNRVQVYEGAFDKIS